MDSGYLRLSRYGSRKVWCEKKGGAIDSLVLLLVRHERKKRPTSLILGSMSGYVGNEKRRVFLQLRIRVLLNFHERFHTSMKTMKKLYYFLQNGSK